MTYLGDVARNRLGAALAGARGFDLDIPPNVLAAEAALAAAANFDVESLEAPDFWSMSAAEVRAYMSAAAAREIRRAAVPPIRAHAVNLLGKRLTRAVRDAGPAWLEVLAPRFAKAGAAFAKLHDGLPPGYEDSAELVKAGPKAVELYQKAQAAGAELEALGALRDDLASIGVAVKGLAPAVERATRHCRVESLAAADRAAAAFAARHPLGWPAALLEVAGVLELRWCSVEAQAAEVAALPDGTAGDTVARTDGFKGTRRLPVMTV